jgi:uncharacterized protein (TIGR02246 family)
MVGETVAENNRLFAAAAALGDARAMTSVYADDAELLPPNADPLHGRQAIERFWEGGIEVGIRGVELETHSLEQTENLAYEVGRYTLLLEDGETSVADVGKYVVIHRRGPDGDWRRAIEIFNWNAPLD